MASLGDSLNLGSLHLRNRIVMSPLTRCRAPGRIPNALMAEYYGQRASAGLIISEGAAISPTAVGYPDTPGLWSREQVAAWKLITKTVHDSGGLIVAQLWHCGRISDASLLGGAEPVAPSAIACEGHVNLLRPFRPFPVPRALETAEIPAIVESYRTAARNALEAGFDGVELHGANGYLLDQFLHENTNRRTDNYGGSVENRARLLLEATDACIEVCGAGRVGVHLSPRGTKHSIELGDVGETYGYVARQLGERRIAFIFIRDRFDGGPRITPLLKEEFGGAVIANDGLTIEQARGLIASGEADAVAWGELFIANPDLPRRILHGAPLNTPNKETFYVLGGSDLSLGYTDYPTLLN